MRFLNALLCLWCLAGTSLTLAMDAPVAGPVVLDRGTQHVPLGEHTMWWLEEGSARTIDEVETGPLAAQFQPGHASVLNFGFRDDPVWLRLQVTNPGTAARAALLSVDYPILDRIDLWVRGRAGRTHQMLGDTLPYSERPLQVYEHVFPLELAAGETVTIHMRVQSQTSLTIPLFLSSERGFTEAVYRAQWGAGIFYGVLLAMAVYAILSYLITRHRILVSYTVFVLSILLVAATLDGVGFSYWGNALHFQQYAQYFFILLASLCALRFTREFVKPGLVPWMALVERMLTILHLVGMPIIFLFDPGTAGKSTLMLLMVTVLFLVVGALWRWLRDDYAPARIYVLSLSPTLILIVLNVLAVGGIIEQGMLPPYLYRFGFILQVVLFAGIQGQRMTRLQSEKAELRNLAIQAQAEYKARSEFMARISHEIRTPMNGILGMVDLLRDTPLESRQKQFLSVVRNSGMALLGVINDVLDFSKIESGHMELDPVDFSPDVLVSDALSIFVLQCERKGLNIYAAVDPAIPGTVHGDSLRLRQVLINLVGNAYKFTATGHVRIRVQLRPRADDERIWLRFEVEDSGIGIPESVIGRLFQSFSQADASTTRRFGGTGLGLAICRQLCALMGGEVGVTSRPDQGSTFHAELPFAPACEEVGLRDEYDALLRAESVLLVEPNEELGAMLAEEVRQLGGRLDHFVSGQAAEQHLQSLDDAAEPAYQWVAISSELPEGDSISLAKKLVDNGFAWRDCILLFTGMDEHISPDELCAAGIRCALPRPVSRYQLGVAIAGMRQNLTSAPDDEQLDDKASFLSRQGLRVLVAEDNPVNQMVSKAYLKKLRLEPVFANDGLEATRLVRDAGDAPYDVILMDCVMPEMDGFEAARQIRQFELDSARPRSIIIATTAHVAPEELNRVMQAGMDDCLSKPFDLEGLTECLYSWVKKRQQTTNPEAEASQS